MKYLIKLIVMMTAVITLHANAAKPQLDVQVSVNKADNGNVNATLSITNNGHGLQKILGWYTDLNE